MRRLKLFAVGLLALGLGSCGLAEAIADDFVDDQDVTLFALAGSSGSVVSGPWAGSSSGHAYAPTSDRAKLDALLDKISEGGMDSLSKSELKQLETLRRRLRGE